MGRQKSSSSTTKNALITQFFKKPEANVKKQIAKNDENALTEQEIQERNRRLLQRVDEGDHKKKRPVLRPALSDKSGLGGGLGTKQTVKAPKRHEPACNVLCDNEEPIKKDVGNSKTTINVKERRAPLQEKQVETTKVSMPKSWSTSRSTLNEESPSPIRSREEEHDKSETVAKDTSDDSSSISPCTKDQPAARVKRRRIEDEELIPTTIRKVLPLKPLSRQSEKEEQHKEDNETTSDNDNDKATIYPNEEEDDDDDEDDDAACPVYYSPSPSQDDPLSLSPELRPPSSDLQPSPESRSSSNSRSPTHHHSSPDHTLPLSLTEQYEEHVAFPVPRGRNLIEKLGIQDPASSQSSSHSTNNDEPDLA